MKASKPFSAGLLSAAVLVSPRTSFAGTPQYFETFPEITINIGEDANNYLVDYSI
jgi:hypothetical protein